MRLNFKNNYNDYINDQDFMREIEKQVKENCPYKRATPADITYGYSPDEVEIYDEHGLLLHILYGHIVEYYFRNESMSANCLSIYLDGLLCLSIVDQQLVLNRLSKLIF